NRRDDAERSEGNESEILSLLPSTPESEKGRKEGKCLTSHSSSGSIDVFAHFPTVHVTVTTTCESEVSVDERNPTSCCFFS
ncbi:hypothetical protein PMAYCL1PPCAC_07996, partial [Pristionchus mayeri]